MTLLGDEKSNLLDKKDANVKEVLHIEKSNLVDKESNSEQNPHSDVAGLF